MGEIRNFDKSRRTHYRSDDDLERIHKNLPWNRKPAIRWGMVAMVFAGAALATQLGVWEYQRIKARKARFAELPANIYFEGCNEVRARGLAPLHRGDPGYGAHMDGDGDGVACEPHLEAAIPE
jgi:hypothetical protein